MPDISMCKNQDCPSRERCYRFTAKSRGDNQSYANFAPGIGHVKCDDFMDDRFENDFQKVFGVGG